MVQRQVFHGIYVYWQSVIKNGYCVWLCNGNNNNTDFQKYSTTNLTIKAFVNTFEMYDGEMFVFLTTILI